MTTIDNELTRLYENINEQIFNSLLPIAIFTIYDTAERGKKQLIYESSRVYNIYIHENVLYDDAETIIRYLLHQMIHIYCKCNGIKEVSRNDRYHNSKYNKEALKHGLITEWNSTNGFHTIEIKKDVFLSVKKYFSEENWKLALDEYKKIRQPKENIKHKGPYRVQYFICPQCDSIANGHERIKIICGTCNVNMVPSDMKKKPEYKMKEYACVICNRRMNGLTGRKYTCGYCFHDMVEGIYVPHRKYRKDV